MHKTSLAEINDLRELIDRDLADADVSGLSADRSFAIAYNAALQIAQMVIACHGYRVRSIPVHHQATFEALELVFGSSSSALNNCQMGWVVSKQIVDDYIHYG